MNQYTAITAAQRLAILMAAPRPSLLDPSSVRRRPFNPSAWAEGVTEAEFEAQRCNVRPFSLPFEYATAGFGTTGTGAGAPEVPAVDIVVA